MAVFLYKILHHVLVTNNVLYKWKIVDSLNCTFYDTEIETIDHMFIECNMICQLWKGLSVFILYNTGIPRSIEKSK